MLLNLFFVRVRVAQFIFVGVRVAQFLLPTIYGIRGEHANHYATDANLYII
jgi:hypothetical protein